MYKFKIKVDENSHELDLFIGFFLRENNMYQWYITNAHQKNIAIPLYKMQMDISDGKVSPSVRICGNVCGDIMNCVLKDDCIYVLIRWRKDKLKQITGKELKAYFSAYKILDTCESPLYKNKNEAK